MAFRDGSPFSGRIAHRISTPAGVLEQLQAIMAVVCRLPTVRAAVMLDASRSDMGPYETAATPSDASIAYGQRWTLTPRSSLPLKIAVYPSVTAYIHWVSPTTAVKLVPNTADPRNLDGLSTGTRASHVGAVPVTVFWTIANATFTQLSTISPMLEIPATRKLNAGSRSGMHIMVPNALSYASAHRTVVACGTTIVICSAKFHRLCRPIAKFRSSRGNTRRSAGADRVPQKLVSSSRASATSWRAWPMPDNRSNTRFSCTRHVSPTHRKASVYVWMPSERSRANPNSVVAILSRVRISLSAMGSRPWDKTALPHQTDASQSGSSARTRMSTSCSGNTTKLERNGPSTAL